MKFLLYRDVVSHFDGGSDKLSIDKLSHWWAPSAHLSHGNCHIYWTQGESRSNFLAMSKACKGPCLSPWHMVWPALASLLSTLFLSSSDLGSCGHFSVGICQGTRRSFTQNQEKIVTWLFYLSRGRWFVEFHFIMQTCHAYFICKCWKGIVVRNQS